MAKQLDTHSSVFGTVLISDLHIDPEAQRKISPGWVKEHVPVFDVEQLGYIVVNKRATGFLYVVDGQHRVELMRAVGWGDQRIHAECFDGLTQAQEAALFIARNDRKAVSKFSKFKVQVTAKDPTACDIDRIVKEHGLLVSDQQMDGHLCAVAALEKIYNGAGIASPKEGPKALGKALDITVQAWGKQTSSVNGKVIEGLGMVFLRYNGAIKEKDMITKLRPIAGGAPGLLGKGRSQQDTSGRPLAHCIASIIVSMYNKGRTTSKLEAWES